MNNLPNAMFVSLLIFVSLTDVFGYYLADLTISNPQEPSEYIYEKCLSMNKIVYEDRCWDLLTRGPCDEGQWLVLEKVSDEVQLQEPRPLLRVKCKRRRCSESDVYWPRDGFCHDQETARRDRLCAGANTVLAIDEYGDGFCKCYDGGNVPYVRVISSDNDDYNSQQSQPCYPVYSKGPCPIDHVLTPYRARHGICTVDDCAEERRLTDSSSLMSQRSGLQQQRWQPNSLTRWIDGQCYELGTRGPCTGHEQFAIARATMQPDCVRLSVELTVLPKTTDRPGCQTDHWGNCEEGIEVSTTPNELKDALLKNAKRHRSKGATDEFLRPLPERATFNWDYCRLCRSASQRVARNLHRSDGARDFGLIIKRHHDNGLTLNTPIFSADWPNLSSLHGIQPAHGFVQYATVPIIFI